MKTMARTTLAMALIGFGWAAASGAAQAGNSTAMQHAELRKVCTQRGGRFEQTWLYDDQGIRWGNVLSCATSAGYVICRASTCQSVRWPRSHGLPVAADERSKSIAAKKFPAEPIGFADALSALTSN
ncbi:MAG: hypothetical protein ACR2PM_09095 [Hyphomicrobiales bacterium]